ncbi:MULTISPECIES: hypothetical protein [Aphanothece]|uniref:hypothetical protein n=1 Tax=Aphanothece TaxID=1121 RepID=UPI003984C2CD
MSLAEVLVSAVVFTGSATCSLQLWSTSTQWTQRAQQQREQLIELDGRLLAVQAELEQLAGQPVAADCGAAASWLAAHLSDLEPRGEGVLLRVEGQSGLERERWLDPAAYGLCGAAEPVDMASGLPGDAGGSKEALDLDAVEPSSIGSGGEAPLQEVSMEPGSAPKPLSGADASGGSSDGQP